MHYIFHATLSKCSFIGSLFKISVTIGHLHSKFQRILVNSKSCRYPIISSMAAIAPNALAQALISAPSKSHKDGLNATTNSI